MLNRAANADLFASGVSTCEDPRFEFAERVPDILLREGYVALTHDVTATQRNVQMAAKVGFAASIRAISDAVVGLRQARLPLR